MEMGDAPDDPSEVMEGALEVIGTVRLSSLAWALWMGCVGLGASPGSSSGMASGAGRGRPRATETNWYSVHESECSLRPRQKGAILRSI